MSEETHPARHEYDLLADQYDRRWKLYIDATMRLVTEAVHFHGHETVLDVPCGTGELEQRLFLRWPELNITGVDLSRNMLRRARTKDAEGRAKWIEADVADLPLPDAAFDIVVCANSFHFFRSPGVALSEMWRVTRPGGTLILVDWCDDYITCKLCSLWLRWTDPAFFRTYSLRGCRTLVEQTGFRVQEANRQRINWLWGLMRLVCRRSE